MDTRDEARLLESPCSCPTEALRIEPGSGDGYGAVVCGRCEERRTTRDPGLALIQLRTVGLLERIADAQDRK